MADEIGKLAVNSSSSVGEIQKICGETNANILGVEHCFNDILDFLENDIVHSTHQLMEISELCRENVNALKRAIGEIQKAAGGVYESALNIGRQVERVSESSHENEIGVENIISKTEKTSTIADSVNSLVNGHRSSVETIEEIVHTFHH